MDGESKFWLCVWPLIATAIMAVVLSIGFVVRESNRVYLAHGCTIGTLPGAGGAQWICPGK